MPDAAQTAYVTQQTANQAGYPHEKGPAKFQYKREVPEADWSKGPKDVRPSLLTDFIEELEMNHGSTLDVSGTYVRAAGIMAMLGPLRSNNQIRNINFNRELAFLI